MKRTILITICLFAMIAALTFSCKKKDYTGCNSSSKQFVCTINKNGFTADSSGCTFDTLNNIIYLFARDTSSRSYLYFTVKHALEDMEINLKSTDSLYSGKCTGFKNNKYFVSEHGNFAMTVNADKTVCGQFFFNDKADSIDVSVGKFTKIPIK